MAFGCASRGEHSLKHIARPVHVYAVDWALQAPLPVAELRKGALPLPDRPSIAVLPFANMSQDPEQEYFADGLSEDLITALAKYRWFFVIARNSSFTYKGRAVPVQQVGRELGVRYVVEGSTRRSGNRVRVTAQLVEAAPAIISGRTITIASSRICSRCRTRSSGRWSARSSPA